MKTVMPAHCPLHHAGKADVDGSRPVQDTTAHRAVGGATLGMRRHRLAVAMGRAACSSAALARLPAASASCSPASCFRRRAFLRFLLGGRYCSRGGISVIAVSAQDRHHLAVANVSTASSAAASCSGMGDSSGSGMAGGAGANSRGFRGLLWGGCEDRERRRGASPCRAHRDHRFSAATTSGGNSPPDGPGWAIAAAAASGIC